MKLQARIRRLQQKIKGVGKCLNPPLAEQGLRAFEVSHRVRLPETFREFLLRVGNGGMDGPPYHGLVPLRLCPWREGDHTRRYWVDLPDLARPFPFKQRWFHAEQVPEEVAAGSDQSLAEQTSNGCLFLGEDGCGADWRLVVSGPCRGTVWYADHLGVAPTKPKRDFLQWIEDWLDGVDPEEMLAG